MQYADGEGQCGFLCSYDIIYAWLISLIWIFGFREMKGNRISHIRRCRKNSGLGTDEACYEWQQRWLQWHQEQFN
jgi:hypothetical protein